MALGLGWIGVALFLSVAHAQGAPRDPDCKNTVNAPNGDFNVRIRRGLALAYASPITVTGWQHPAAACRQFSAAARVTVGSFRWRGLSSLNTGVERLRISTMFSYAWQYDHRYVLQRIEPGLELFGSPVDLPLTRWFLNLDIADLWRLRFESTIDLAALTDSPAWLASMNYKF